MDKRVIENIKEYDKGLNLIRELKPILFKHRNSGKNDLGLITQDVEALDPILVSRAEVDYNKLVIVMVNAIKELSQEIESLKVKKNKK